MPPLLLTVACWLKDFVHETFHLRGLDRLASLDFDGKRGLDSESQVVGQTRAHAKSFNLALADGTQDRNDTKEIRHCVPDCVEGLLKRLHEQFWSYGVTQLVKHVPKLWFAKRRPTLSCGCFEEAFPCKSFVLAYQTYDLQKLRAANVIALVDIHPAPVLPAPVVRQWVPQPVEGPSQLELTNMTVALGVVHPEHGFKLCHLGRCEALLLSDEGNDLHDILEKQLVGCGRVLKALPDCLVQDVRKHRVVQAVEKLLARLKADAAPVVEVEPPEQEPHVRDLLFETEAHDLQEFSPAQVAVLVGVEFGNDLCGLLDGRRSADIAE
mmetsp:Transcript_30617/g.84170  ORF Transcript_30617/g.84170 Transcript_30617/m.84170 type:complete len:324 (+) Transcript_30617:527-1498(+)